MNTNAHESPKMEKIWWPEAGEGDIDPVVVQPEASEDKADPWTQATLDPPNQTLAQAAGTPQQSLQSSWMEVAGHRLGFCRFRCLAGCGSTGIFEGFGTYSNLSFFSCLSKFHYLEKKKV